MEQIANKPGRTRRNRQEILRLLDEFKKTDVSRKEFCLTHGISKASFHKWQSRYKNKTKVQTKPTGFADLQIISSSSHLHATLFAEVKGIKIFQPVAATYLKELLQ